MWFFGQGPVVPVLRFSGPIGLATPLRSGLTIAHAAAGIEKAFELSKTPAVAVLINSPGGSAVQSSLIFRRLRQLAEEKQKKVYVFCEEAVGDSTRYATRDLADAVLTGDRLRLTRALAHLQDSGETPILALWQLTQDLQRLIDGNSFGQPPRRRELLERAQRRRPAAVWHSLLAQAARVDRANKGVGSGVEPWQALTALALRMAGPAATQRS